MRSNCCSGQVCCVVLCVVSAASLLDPILAGERIGEIAQHASARSQRPPVHRHAWSSRERRLAAHICVVEFSSAKTKRRTYEISSLDCCVDSSHRHSD